VKIGFSGLNAWLLQRITALYMLVFVVVCLVHFTVDPPHSYQAWRGWMMDSTISITTSAFFAALLSHAWVGLRDVILDYIPSVALRVGLLVMLASALVAAAAVVVHIFWIQAA